jgi:hypothetical protein
MECSDNVREYSPATAAGLTEDRTRRFAWNDRYRLRRVDGSSRALRSHSRMFAVLREAEFWASYCKVVPIEKVQRVHIWKA